MDWKNTSLSLSHTFNKENIYTATCEQTQLYPFLVLASLRNFRKARNLVTDPFPVFFSSIAPMFQSFLLLLANRAGEESSIRIHLARVPRRLRSSVCMFAREHFAGKSISHGGTGVVVSNNSPPVLSVDSRSIHFRRAFIVPGVVSSRLPKLRQQRRVYVYVRIRL